jgi:hypothetical protein
MHSEILLCLCVLTAIRMNIYSSNKRDEHPRAGVRDWRCVCPAVHDERFRLKYG